MIWGSLCILDGPQCQDIGSSIGLKKSLVCLTFGLLTGSFAGAGISTRTIGVIEGKCASYFVCFRKLDNFGDFLTILDLYIEFTIWLIQTLNDTNTSLSGNAIPWQPYEIPYEIHCFPLEARG